MPALAHVRRAEPVDLPHVWRVSELALEEGGVLPCGHAALDAHLPGGGWPLDGMVELLQAQAGQHVWQLLLPALAQVTQQQHGPVVLVGAPYVPFAPGLAAQGLAGERLLCVRADKPAARLWATEQALRCADVVAVLAWLPHARAPDLRRLHLAAQQQRRLLFVLRPLAAQHMSSPARLRLVVVGEGDALQVCLIKRRGPPLDAPVDLPAHPARLAALLAARRGRKVGQSVEPGVTVPTFRTDHALARPVTA